MSIKTIEYKTRTISIKRANPSIDGVWEIALDLGYSAVKGESPNAVYSFPAFAMPSKEEFIGKLDERHILYRDNSTGAVWSVGDVALSQIELSDTNESEETLYGRERYGNPMFLVIARTGLGLGMMKNEFGNPDGKQLVLQSGLPPKYLKRDTGLLCDVLSGHHDFSLKVGNADWVSFEFDLLEENIFMMPQPLGTLVSVSTDKNGNSVPEANDYLAKKTVIFDPGFGTLDIYTIMNRQVKDAQTFTNLGMKRVLQETSRLIDERYGVDIPVPAMQKYLETGMINVADRRAMTCKAVPFDDILEIASNAVCDEALQRLEGLHDVFELPYLINTGGTGAAWSERIRKKYTGISTLKIISGNVNDTLPHIFNNVRGYYMYRYGKIRAGKR